MTNTQTKNKTIEKFNNFINSLNFQHFTPRGKLEEQFLTELFEQNDLFNNEEDEYVEFFHYKIFGSKHEAEIFASIIPTKYNVTTLEDLDGSFIVGVDHWGTSWECMEDILNRFTTYINKT